ncbi:MAG: Dethiobiotin synthetase [Cyanobacteria bacterium J06635_15]
MDFSTARTFILSQTLDSETKTDTFYLRLQQGQPPIPGQVTTLLLALKVLFEGLHRVDTLERELAHALFILSYESRVLYDTGLNSGVEWPPMLDEDLSRIAIAARNIFANQRQR